MISGRIFQLPLRAQTFWRLSPVLGVHTGSDDGEGPKVSIRLVASPKKKTAGKKRAGGGASAPEAPEESGRSYHGRDYVLRRREQLSRGRPELYPAVFRPTHTMQEAADEFGPRLAHGAVEPGAGVRVCGRVGSVRQSGKGLYFVDLMSEGGSLQVKASGREYGGGGGGDAGGGEGALPDDVGALRRGDWVGVEGAPCRTKAGEMSILAKKVGFRVLSLVSRTEFRFFFLSQVTLLAPCLWPLPKHGYEPEATDKRFRKR